MTDDQTPAPEPASQPEPEQAPAEQAPAEPAPAEPAAEQAPAEPAAEQAPAEPPPAEPPVVPRPSAPRPSAPRPHAPRPTTPTPAAPTSDPSTFGRVADDGTVFVRTSDGEREVGSYPGASPDEALAYFGRKYDEIVAQVDLFEQRLGTADVPASEIESGVAKLRAAAADAHAVGDLAALQARIEALAPALAARREHDEHARSAAREEARARRTALVEEAEAIAAVPAERTQWRADGLRMKQLFEQWRTEQKSAGRGAGHGAGHAGAEPAPARLDRRSEDELWKRFSHARTAFDRKRRQHFAHLDEQHEEARETKERLVKEAEALQSSTDWGPTAAAFKRLMDRWRAAGRAARKDDDELWTRFSAAQDAFFAARHAVQAEQDAEFGANLATKEALLVEAEKLVPVTDLTEARSRLRDIQDRWEAAGHVPRGDMDRIERRMRAVEQTVRSAEDDRWKNTNPEARARAQSAVDQLEVVISDLHEQISKAQAAGKASKVAELQASLEAREQWLEQARGALADFGA